MALNVLERVQPQGMAIAEAMTQVRGEIRVSAPAIVQSFDADAQTIVALIAIGERIRLGGGVLTDVTFKPIADVPICIPQGGIWALTFPIQPGDECDLLFADGCIDSWFQNGGQQARMDGRRHSIADAVALFGLRSQPRKLTSYSTTSAQLRSEDGNTVIDLADNVITIRAATVNVESTNATIQASQKVQVEATTEIDITCNAGVKINATDWATHTHSGVTAGGGVTGPVVP
jgi:phage baseplate assembly protein gpV